MRFATDTGGTFTDLLIEDEVGRVHMFKAATVPSEPVKGVLDAFDLAARQFQIDRRTLLGRGKMFIHGTTRHQCDCHKKTAKTALLVTQGHLTSWCCAKAGGSSRLTMRSRIPIHTFRAR